MNNFREKLLAKTLRSNILQEDDNGYKIKEKFIDHILNTLQHYFLLTKEHAAHAKIVILNLLDFKGGWKMFKKKIAAYYDLYVTQQPGRFLLFVAVFYYFYFDASFIVAKKNQVIEKFIRTFKERMVYYHMYKFYLLAKKKDMEKAPDFFIDGERRNFFLRMVHENENILASIVKIIYVYAVILKKYRSPKSKVLLDVKRMNKQMTKDLRKPFIYILSGGTEEKVIIDLIVKENKVPRFVVSTIYHTMPSIARSNKFVGAFFEPESTADFISEVCENVWNEGLKHKFFKDKADIIGKIKIRG